MMRVLLLTSVTGFLARTCRMKIVAALVLALLFLNRAMSLLSDLRKTRGHVEAVRAPILRDALDP